MRPGVRVSELDENKDEEAGLDGKIEGEVEVLRGKRTLRVGLNCRLN